jgi:hypothetical protein
MPRLKKVTPKVPPKVHFHGVESVKVIDPARDSSKLDPRPLGMGIPCEDDSGCLKNEKCVGEEGNGKCILSMEKIEAQVDRLKVDRLKATVKEGNAKWRAGDPDSALALYQAAMVGFRDVGIDPPILKKRIAFVRQYLEQQQETRLPLREKGAAQESAREDVAARADAAVAARGDSAQEAAREAAREDSARCGARRDLAAAREAARLAREAAREDAIAARERGREERRERDLERARADREYAREVAEEGSFKNQWARWVSAFYPYSQNDHRASSKSKRKKTKKKLKKTKRKLKKTKKHRKKTNKRNR